MINWYSVVLDFYHLESWLFGVLKINVQYDFEHKLEYGLIMAC